MQIRASRRQTSAQTGRRPHKVLARHWALQRRLVVGSAVALVASVLAWLFGVSFPVHLGVVLAGFGAGFFWRFTAVGRRAERWAFSWIEERAGLSYLTAYELPQADAEVNSETDPVAGFGEAVRARAAQVGRLETPSLQPWALPLIVLALALAALPHLVLPTWRAPLAPLTGRLPFLTPQTDLPTPEDALAAAPKPRTGTTPSAPETGTETGQESTDTPGDSGTDSSDTGASFNDAAAPSEGGAATGERAALENFLEQSGAAQTGASQANQEGVPQRGLPQTSPPQTAASPTETAQTDASQTDTSQAGTSQSAPPGGGGDQAQSGQRPAETGSAQPRASNTSGDTPNNRGGATAPGEGSPVGREAKAKSDVGQNPEQNSGQNAGQEGAAQAETPGSADESAQESSSQSAQPPQAQANSPQSGSQQASQAGADAAQNSSASSQGSNAQRSAAPDAGNQASGDATNGASSNRAGTRAGGDIASSRERLGNASPQTPERVTGSRQDGPLSFAGETLRQGDAPDALPQNGSAAYRRAAEEVIREGRIPLEYQEIVRDYFR